MGVSKPQELYYNSPPNFYDNNHNDNNNNNNDPTITDTITDFYKNSTIFLTGATGFVGKAIVEKLLRTCDGLTIIYVLMRPKRGMLIEQRLKELFKNPVFNRIREKQPEIFNKVKAISGDVALKNLGLTETDRNQIINNVNIVIHSAATVKFNEDLKNAVILNTLGTKRVVELCYQMRQLKSFVHVSTAYSNSDKEIVDEIIYKPPHDPESIINCIELLSDDNINELSKKLLGKHPNTYTLTKAMAEYIVMESSSILPAAVVRPSIITAAWKEPFPGWVDNVSGITGIFMECGRGTIKSIICDDRCVMDLIPVDIVVNTIITAAWHTVVNRSNIMRVYNCTSGNMNPITWKDFGQLTHKYWRQYPSKYVTWYPGFTYRKNRYIHMLYVAFYHLLPSIFLDVFLYCTKQKPIMFKISKKFYNALDAGKFFSTNEWDFKIATMHSLIRDVNRTKDGGDFVIDMRYTNGFDWDAYLKDFTLGVRKYVLKDDITSLTSAKIKLKRLFWLQKISQAIMIYSLIRTVAR